MVCNNEEQPGTQQSQTSDAAIAEEKLTCQRGVEEL